MRTKALFFLACALAATGCGLGRETAPTSPSGAPQVRGTVARAGVAAEGMKVKLYDDLEQVQIDSAVTGGDGAYGFSGVTAGRWMVKVSPTDPVDLGYVRFFFDVARTGDPVVVPPFDVSAYGFDLIDPADGIEMPRPSFSAPLTLRWSAYQATSLWASARIDDSLGVLAWASAQNSATQAAWNGLGNQAPYSGTAVPPGRYAWRVKLRLANGVQAASRVRQLVLQ